jgi:hypothetical protein
MRLPENEAGDDPSFSLPGQMPGTLSAKAAKTLDGRTSEPTSEGRSILRRCQRHSRIPGRERWPR